MLEKQLYLFCGYIHFVIEHFSINIESTISDRILWFCLILICDCIRKLVILSQPVRLKTEINCDLKDQSHFLMFHVFFCFNFLGSRSHGVFVILIFFRDCMAIISDFF